MSVDRVLLLHARGPGDVVPPGAGHHRADPDSRSRRAQRGDRHLRRDRARRRGVPAGLRPHRRARSRRVESTSGLAERIHRAGPVPFSTFVEAALYDPEPGSSRRGRGAGRAGGDFVTSPEVGPLFGACVARALDRWWHALGGPDPFVVMEAGAGTGRLCREVLRAEPECAAALRYVLVERSAPLRDAQRELLTVEPFEHALGPSSPDLDGGMPEPVGGSGPIVSALEELPALDRRRRGDRERAARQPRRSTWSSGPTTGGRRSGSGSTETASSTRCRCRRRRRS